MDKANKPFQDFPSEFFAPGMSFCRNDYENRLVVAQIPD
jgi:hypothetical protein